MRPEVHIPVPDVRTQEDEAIPPFILFPMQVISVTAEEVLLNPALEVENPFPKITYLFAIAGGLRQLARRNISEKQFSTVLSNVSLRSLLDEQETPRPTPESQEFIDIAARKTGEEILEKDAWEAGAKAVAQKGLDAPIGAHLALALSFRLSIHPPTQEELLHVKRVEDFRKSLHTPLPKDRKEREEMLLMIKLATNVAPSMMPVPKEIRGEKDKILDMSDQRLQNNLQYAVKSLDRILIEQWSEGPATS